MLRRENVAMAAGTAVAAAPWRTHTRHHHPRERAEPQTPRPSAHAARSTQDFLKENIVSNWAEEFWSPFLPDLISLVFSI
jgi:hypothetical protein